MMTPEEILAQLGPNPTVEELAAHAKGLLGDTIIPIEPNTIYEFSVLLHDWDNDEKFDEFHDQMLSPEGTEFIPARAVECSNFRPLSRSTNYLLTAEEATLLAEDPRVADIDRTLSAKGVQLRPMVTQTSSGWDKSGTVTNSMRNWGLLRCTNRAQISNWGSDGTVSQTATISLPNQGENVDVVIVDGHVNANHPEFAVNPDGTGGSRVVQYNWFALNPTVKGTSSSTYSYSLTSANTTTRISIYQNNAHGSNVASIAAGNTNGWARKANIYNIYPYDSSIVSSDDLFAYIRAWHAVKPINTATGRKNPTVVNASFGISYQDFAYTIDTVYYRGTTTTQPASAPAGQSGLQATYNGKWTTTQLTNAGVRLYSGYLSAYDVGLAFSMGQDANLAADALDAAAEGIIVVGSAGNSWGTPNDVIGGLDYDNYYKTQLNFNGVIFNNFYTRYNYRGPTPAASQRGTSYLNSDYEEIICVGNLGSTVNEQVSFTSNTGKKVNIFAPGENIMGATYSGTVSPWYTQPGVADSRSGSYYLNKMTGTSQASPQVAGLVACLMGVEPHLKMKDVIRFIKTISEYNHMWVPSSPAFQDDYQLRGADNLILNYSTQTLATYTLSSVGRIQEGGSLTVTLNVSTLTNGTTVAYSVSGITSGDLTSGSLTGEFNIQNNTSSTTFVFAPNAINVSPKTFNISLPNSLATKSVTIFDTPTYTISSQPSSINEGSSGQFVVTTTNLLDGDVLYWTVNNITTQNQDFSSTSGSFVINTNTGTFTVPVYADLTTEGLESFTVSIRTGSISGSVVATSGSININDTSLTSTNFNFTSIPSSINEGSFGNFQVSTVGISDGTVLYWRVNHGNTTATDFSAVSGSFVINSNAGYFTINPVADSLTEGSKSFTVILSETQNGSAVANSNSVTVNDTSQAPLVPGIVTRLTSQGVLLVNGTFDEITMNRNSVAPGVVYTAELDEITIHPIANGLAKRETHDGKLLVSGEFDEVTLPGSA